MKTKSYKIKTVI